MVDLMCGAGYHGAALDLERLWNVFTADRPIVSGCAYALDRFSHERHISLLPLICDQHTHVIPEEVLAHPSQARERLASIALLQHRARALRRGRDAESQARVDPARTAVSTVYVIDDDPSVRRSLARLVTSVGLPVRTFDSAEAFLDNANTAEGGCLIVDIQLLGMSGMDLMRRLAAVRRHWPVVAMSGADDASVEQAAFRLGAVVFLRKLSTGARHGRKYTGLGSLNVFSA
jgi:CheY-like chemotaxis protein